MRLKPLGHLSHDGRNPTNLAETLALRTLLRLRTFFFPLLNCRLRFRDRLIGRTSAFEAEYRGSSPRPGTNFFHGFVLPWCGLFQTQKDNTQLTRLD